MTRMTRRRLRLLLPLPVAPPLAPLLGNGKAGGKRDSEAQRVRAGVAPPWFSWYALRLAAGWSSGSREGGAVFAVLSAETEAQTETAAARPTRNVAAEGGVGSLVGGVGAHLRNPPRPVVMSGARPRL